MADTSGLNIEQVFFRYELWEDYQSGMYKSRNDPDAISKSEELFNNPDECLRCMERVVNEWKIAAQQVLTNPGSNGRAWLGQSACFLYAGCHDEETRKAWVRLSPSVQKTANRIAEDVIRRWLENFAKECPNYQTSLFD